MSPTSPAADEGAVKLAEKIIANPNGYNEASVTVARAYLAERKRSEATIDALREALRPFSELGREVGDGVMAGIIWPDSLVIEGARAYNNGTDYVITVGDLRRAAACIPREGSDGQLKQKE